MRLTVEWGMHTYIPTGPHRTCPKLRTDQSTQACGHGAALGGLLRATAPYSLTDSMTSAWLAALSTLISMPSGPYTSPANEPLRFSSSSQVCRLPTPERTASIATSRRCRELLSCTIRPAMGGCSQS